jgi:hypothetical protein
MYISPQTYRAFEILDEFTKSDKKKNLKDYSELISCLIDMQEAIDNSNISTSLPKWKSYIGTFINKAILHCNAIYTLLNEIKITYKRKNETIKIFDLPSSYVLLRSQLENFLMMNFIYFMPSNEKEQEFRFNNWLYYSLKQRKKFTAHTDVLKKLQKEDVIRMDNLKKEIEVSSYFMNFTKNQRRTIIEKGEDKLFHSWDDLIKLSNLNPKVFRSLYSILSSHAHSGALSIMNLIDNKLGFDKDNSSAYLVLYISRIILSLLIYNYKDYFKSAKIVYNTFSAEILDYIKIFVTLGIKK